VSEALMAAGVLVKATSEQVIRIAPPLTIEPSDLEWAVARVAEVLG
jgi:ornithine--oxo-acid transaminase